MPKSNCYTKDLGPSYDPSLELHVLNIAHLKRYYKITESKWAPYFKQLKDL